MVQTSSQNLHLADEAHRQVSCSTVREEARREFPHVNQGGCYPEVISGAPQVCCRVSGRERRNSWAILEEDYQRSVQQMLVPAEHGVSHAIRVLVV
jgi:hypothetical protein